MLRRDLYTGAFALFMAALAVAADMDELRVRRLRAADVFSDGILLLHANPALDEAAAGFRQDARFYYFTGLENTAGAILAIDGRSRDSWLFLPTLEGSPGSDAIQHTGIEHVLDWSDLKGFLEKRGASPTPLYYVAPARTLADLPANFTSPNAARTPLWVAGISQKYPSFRLKEVGRRVDALLDVQSPSEMIHVRAAAMASVQAITAGMRAIKPGLSQRSAEAVIADACWKAGAHGVAFWPWAMAGSNGVFPRPFASLTRYDHLNAVMEPGDLVRLDIGCESEHYAGDLGRTVPVSGRYSAEQREIWNVFVAAYHAGANSLREGATAEQVFGAWSAELVRHRAAVKNAVARQAIDHWSKREKVPFWQIHTVNLVEGNAAGPLRAGTTVAFEPIASIGGQGFYLEDMFVITKTGAELLTPGVPYSAEEIEQAMQAGEEKPRSAR